MYMYGKYQTLNAHSWIESSPMAKFICTGTNIYNFHILSIKTGSSDQMKISTTIYMNRTFLGQKDVSLTTGVEQDCK